jgi:CubicO group peptidase (beta-lactamase class C family)
MRRLTRWRFPGSEGYRDEVTVRHLLSHTAGLDDGLGYGGFPPGETPQTLEESLALTRDSTVGPPRPVTVAWRPGPAGAYSGAGYTVLQLLIEEVTGQPFADYMKEAVLQPLGMTTATFDPESKEDLSPAFDAGLRPQPHRRYTALAAVALHATARDLGKFVLAHTGDNPVLRPDTLKEMTTPQPATAGSWGLGLALFPSGVVGHDGGTGPAWGAMVRVNPASGNGMALVSSGGRGAVNRLGHDWLYWETGIVTFEARRQTAQARLVPACAAIVLGALFLVAWRSRARG